MTSTQSASDGALTPLAYSNGQGNSEYHAQSQYSSNPAAAAVPTMRYSTLTGVSGALQTKNMSSGFMKEAKNVYWNRRKNDTRQYMREQKAAKRRRFVDGNGGEAADEAQEDDRAASAAPARSNNGRGNDENGDESSGGEDGTSVGAGSARGRTSQTPDVKGKGREYTNVRGCQTRSPRL